MKLSDFNYKLPKELIAQKPIEPRYASRLMVIDKKSGQIEDKKFIDILSCLWKNDVLVINKTSVINARLIWEIKMKNLEKNKCEIFLHKQINDKTWDCLVYPGKKLKIWKYIYFYEKNWNQILKAIIKETSESWRIVEFDIWWKKFLKIIEKIWLLPIPPYIKEKLQKNKRYQTVFNEIPWSVASPTAWLHFTKSLLNKLEKKWVIIEKILLHVWLWTFAWIKKENIKEHKMHSEYVEISKDTAKKLNSFKKNWKKIIAVWTTSVRALESFTTKNWELVNGKKQTDIFIYPGYEWKFVDSMITNFHLPKSTLLILVSSFSSRQKIKKAYEHAIRKKYRFFSFWDAMWIK